MVLKKNADMEKIQKSQENKFDRQEFNLNNNAEKGDYRKKTDCQIMKPRDLMQQKHERLGIRNESTEASNILLEIATENFSKVSLVTQNSNNSTDNLSYLSNSCGMEEVLMLEGNLSDEDTSVNSDDCVYAYRGADFDVPDQRDNLLDDETDFLEMDFDPDPASEIDHINEGNTSSPNPNCSYKDETKPIIAENFEPDQKADKKSIISVTKSHINESKLQSVSNSEKPPERLTGTKPKKVSHLDKFNKVSKVVKHEGTFDFLINNTKENATEIKEPEEACLDCLEKEFLSSTVGKKIDPFQCLKCKFKTNYSNYNQSSIRETHNFSNIVLPENCGEFLQANCQKIPCDTIREENLLITKKETASFLNVEADEKVIQQALEKIDVSFNRDIIRNYFDLKQKSFSDVPEFIIHMSKRNCDYKRIIKLIKAASTSELEIKFIPNLLTGRKDVVEVSSFDILQCWLKNNDLVKLKKLGKQFSQMNVLGKITNLIRQAQQRNADVLNEVIVIPQYYETGYITINKK